MDSLTFLPGDAFLASDSTVLPWTVVFEDEGATGYFYACDRTWMNRDVARDFEGGILDAMLIYNVASLEKRERLASVQWSRDGMRAVLYVDGSAQALVDFAARESCCRSNFPNFLDDQRQTGPGQGWRRSSHAWNEEALQKFEAEIYA